MPAIAFADPASGLSATAELLGDKAPVNAAFLWDLLAAPCVVPSIHAIWTGPEISCPVPDAALTPAQRDTVLPLENATIHPQPGDVVLVRLPSHMWGGMPAPLVDIGLFYGPGARLLLPVGWLAGSVVARVPPAAIAEFAAACGRIRRGGACTITFARAA
jgi:hypothetical protein